MVGGNGSREVTGQRKGRKDNQAGRKEGQHREKGKQGGYRSGGGTGNRVTTRAGKKENEQPDRKQSNRAERGEEGQHGDEENKERKSFW